MELGWTMIYPWWSACFLRRLFEICWVEFAAKNRAWRLKWIQIYSNGGEEYLDINHGPKSQKPVAAVQKRSGNWQLVGWRGHVGTPDGAKKCLVLQHRADFCRRIRVQVRKCYKHLEIIGNLIWEQKLPHTFYRWPQSIPTKHLDSHSQVRLLKGSKGHCFVSKLLISFVSQPQTRPPGWQCATDRAFDNAHLSEMINFCSGLGPEVGTCLDLGSSTFTWINDTVLHKTRI